MGKNKITMTLTIILFGMCILAGCSSFKNITLNEISQEVCPVSCIAMNENEAKEIQDKLPIHLYFVTKDDRLKLVVKHVSLTEVQKDINNVATIIVQELLKGTQDKELRSAIPAGTKLKKPVEVLDGIAHVDLSEEFVKNHKGGKTEEELTIFSIVNSLTELKDIQKVKFKIEGKTLKEYKGNFKFDKDFPRGVSRLYKVSNSQNII